MTTTGLLSLGMLFVILTGGIDLSVGSVVAFSAIFAAGASVNWGLPVWLSFLLGFAAGTLAVKAMNPATDMTLIAIFEGVGALGGMFSAGGIIIALLILLSGFLLYCSLSSVGGALAGKPEDLSSTNVLFTLALIVSFFTVMFSGGLTGGIGDMSPVLLWIPFTGVLSAPGRLILGDMPVLAGVGVLLVTVAVSLLIMRLAGTLYAAMVHHRGNPPDLAKTVRMLRKR
jgi:hypothetical protein